MPLQAQGPVWVLHMSWAVWGCRPDLWCPKMSTSVVSVTGSKALGEGHTHWGYFSVQGVSVWRGVFCSGDASLALDGGWLCGHVLVRSNCLCPRPGLASSECRDLSSSVSKIPPVFNSPGHLGMRVKSCHLFLFFFFLDKPLHAVSEWD